MERSFLSQDEGARLCAVQRYATPHDGLDNLCQRVTSLAARLLKLPAAAVSIVDAAKVWFKSRHGFTVAEIDRQAGFCASAIMSNEPWIVTDALHDARTVSHPLVAAPYGLRFYAGIPLSSPEGYNIGALCVMGYEPRAFSNEDLSILRELAQTLMDGMACMTEGRLSMLEAKKSRPQKLRSLKNESKASGRRVKKMPNDSAKKCRSLLELSSDLYWELDAEFRFCSIVPAPENKCRFSYHDALGKLLEEVPNLSLSNEDWMAYEAALKSHRAFHEITVKWIDGDGQAHYACLSGRPVFSSAGKLTGYLGIARDITEKMRSQEELTRTHAALRQLSHSLQNFREVERKRIACELHDDLAQLLAASRMDLTLLQQELTQEYSFNQRFAALDQLLGSSIVTLRRIATELWPSALDEGGLYFALKFYLKHFSKNEGISCELIADESNLELDEFYSTAVFRVIQEALVNIVRQSQSRCLRLLLYRDGKNLSIMMEYENSGAKAWEANEGINEENQLYLLGMRERIGGLNGVMATFGNPEHSVTLLITIPVEAGVDGTQEGNERRQRKARRPAAQGVKEQGCAKDSPSTHTSLIGTQARRRLINC